MATKLTIEDMQAIAKKRGGECLSKRYVNNVTKLKWKCSEGHTWKAPPARVKYGSWCPRCSGNVKLTIQDMRALAKSRKGKCLSEHYVNAHTELEWECDKGHRWLASPSGLRQKHTWCPQCSGNVKLSIKDMHALAASRHGKCLSKKYVNNSTKLKWECVLKHQWSSTLISVKQGGHWCPVCSGNKKLTIDDMQKIASEYGGRCISRKYKNNNSKLKWECAEGHKWETAPMHIRAGKWCPRCSGNVRLTIKDMKKLAKERGGKCLSKEYFNAYTELEWQCNEGHKWNSKPVNIRNGNGWCPDCSFSIGERICRAYFEQLFSNSFPNTRPKWLTGRRGSPLELDGYCKELKIAFEHQGEQHYTLKSHFIKTKKGLARRKQGDKDKLEICKQNGVRLIRIPELFTRTKLEDLQQFIYDECKKLHIHRPAGMLSKTINLKYAWSSRGNKAKFEEMQAIASSKGGNCLSKHYINSLTKLEWECSDGHRWFATPNQIKNTDTWCPDCGRSKRLTIEDMVKLAKSQGGKCLSTVYVNNQTKLKWECSEGHQWETVPAAVRNGGSWCPKCAGKQKSTIEEMQGIAKKRGGKCISVIYVNTHTKLQWECSEGHHWEAVPSEIKNGTWCPRCSGNVKLTIEEMQEIAKSRGGKCLSKKYTNANTKLKWECSQGHRWDATPNKVKNTCSWCRKCSVK